jgi:ammonia channel protein AmtB
MHYVKTLGLLAGCIAGMVIIKQLNLPGVVTVILIGAMLFGIVYALASLNVDSKKKKTPAEGVPSSDKT